MFLVTFSRECEGAVRFLASVFHSSIRCNRMSLNKKTLLRWYSGALVLVRTGFLRVFVLLKREYAECYTKKACILRQPYNAFSKSNPTAGICNWLNSDRQTHRYIVFCDGTQFSSNDVNTRNSHLLAVNESYRCRNTFSTQVRFQCVV